MDVQQKMMEIRVTKVFNADQTGALFEYLPKNSINKTGSKTVWVRGAGKDKERFTVMLLADSDGVKYPLFVVLKSSRSTVEGGDAANWKYRRGFGIRVWNEAKDIMTSTNMQLYANPTAWWNSDIHIEFLKGSFGHRPRPWQPVLLLVDDFSGHWTSEVQAYAKTIDVHLPKIPPSCTAVSQPADIAWNKPFKRYLRTSWVNMLRDQLQAHTTQNKALKMMAPTRSQRGFWKAHLLPPIPPSDAGQVETTAVDVLDDADVALLTALNIIDGRVGDLSSDDDLDSDEDDEDAEIE